MSNTTFLDLPIVVNPDGNEVLAVITPPSSTTGVSKRMTSAQIAGLAAHLPTTSLATLSVFGNPNPNAAATGTSIPGIAGQVLVINDAGTAVVFGQVNLSNTASVTGTIATSILPTISGLSIIGNSSSAVAKADAIAGTANQVVVVNPAGTGMGFGQVNLSSTAAITGSLNATAYLTGIVSVPLGGSGTSALTANAVLYGNGTGALSLTNTTANGVLTSNASSVPSFAPTLPSAVQANITQVNTLTTGTWNASIIGVTWGGIGAGSLAANSVLLGNGTAAISAVANATSGYVLSANGTSSAATFQQFNLSNATGTLPFSNVTSLAALSLLGNSSSAVTIMAAISGSASQVAVVNDAGTGLAFGRVNLGTSAAVTGTLGAGLGGTGNSTLTANAVLLGNGTSAVTFATIGTSGRALLDQGAGANPSFKAIVGDLTLTSAGTATIANNVVTFAKFQTVAGLSLVGITGTATANVAAITGTTDQVAIVNSGGTAMLFGAVNAAATAALTGNLRINLFNSGSSASTATFWRGDGTWVTPSGAGTVTNVAAGAGLTTTVTAAPLGGAITGSGTLYGTEVVNAQSNTTYTFVDGDRAKLVTASNIAAQAYALPQAGTGSAFQSGWFCDVANISTGVLGVVTITPTTSTINSTATLVLTPRMRARISSDGTNYQVAQIGGSLSVKQQIITSSSTYTPTVGMAFCILETVGAGAGGGGAAVATGFGAGGGGGAGGYSRTIASAATIGAAQTVTIGAPGSGGASGNNNGASGGDTSIGSLCIGKGGSFGSGAAANSIGSGGAGGVVGTGNLPISGASGGEGIASAGITTTPLSGAGGSSFFGGGAPAAGGIVATDGHTATGYGSGGSGGIAYNGSAAAGGAGSQGLAVITEYIYQ